jgi:hypothetical protein
MNKRPLKKDYFAHLQERFGKDFLKTKDSDVIKAERARMYDDLLELVAIARNDSVLMTLAEKTIMDKASRIRYRNTLAEESGIELTPHQLDLYISTIEYALEYIAK